MKISIRRFLAFLMLGLSAAISYAQQDKVVKTTPNFLEMKAIPDGHWLVTLEIEGKAQRLNFEIKNDFARCVNADDAKLKGARGKFQAVGNGVFFVYFQNEHYRQSQHWVFREDGSAFVKEVPDRRENQRAVRVSDDSLPK